MGGELSSQDVCTVADLWVPGAPFHLVVIVAMLLAGEETSHTLWLNNNEYRLNSRFPTIEGR